MKDTIYDAVVIGGGQSGLAAAYYLQKAKLNFLILEKSEKHLGSWANYYDSLTLFSPAKYASLPGLAFPGEAKYYPRRDEVVEYLKIYAAKFKFPISYRQEVAQVSKDSDAYFIHTTSGDEFHTRSIICASGAFVSPNMPSLPGMADYKGSLLHAKDYRNDEAFKGKRIIVVGAGNSAVQIAVELARTTHVTIASRNPIKFLPQKITGKDIHFWLTISGLDKSSWGRRLLKKRSDGVLDTGIYKNAIDQGQPDARPMFKAFTENGVVWSDDTQEEVEVVIFATGYKSNFEYLGGINVLDQNGLPLKQTAENIQFVGIPWQRSLSSATIRGSGKDASEAVKALLKKL